MALYDRVEWEAALAQAQEDVSEDVYDTAELLAQVRLLTRFVEEVIGVLAPLAPDSPTLAKARDLIAFN